MGQALYRKYRSKKLAEIIGQEHITQTLSNALKSGKISHAYLFTGPRGVGKTSIARILAHEVNGLPYSESSLPLDIIEIDAASNRRIDEIRDLRDKVNITPVSSKYKVYIIDEVHMLTKEAFNALLKTLEEPPKHVIFILATTEAHKLPETIVSRTQRFIFKPVDKDQVVAHLREIAKKEKITITDEALGIIAAYGEGSFRDSISLLDQASNSSTDITKEHVLAILGIAPDEAIDQLFELIKSGTAQDIVNFIRQMREAGYQSAIVAKQLSSLLRSKIVSELENSGYMLALVRKLIDVPSSNDPELTLELALLDTNLQLHQPPASSRIMTPAPALIMPIDKPAKIATPPVVTTEAPKTPKKVLKNLVQDVISPPVNHGNTIDLMQVWPEVLTTVRATHNTLHGVLKSAQPRLQEDGLTLVFRYAFHQKRINESKNKQIIADILKTLTGSSPAINCIIDKDALPPDETVVVAVKSEPSARSAVPSGSIDTISNIFGNAEVLES